MREIKFRGKRVDNGEWVYGYFVNCTDGPTALIFTGEYIQYQTGEDSYEISWCSSTVDPSTVCQYTGLKDKNGVDIYEGDITTQDAWMDTVNDDGDTVNILSDKYRYQKLKIVNYNTKSPFCGFNINSVVTVIGNIHDNPEISEAKR